MSCLSFSLSPKAWQKHLSYIEDRLCEGPCKVKLWCHTSLVAGRAHKCVGRGKCKKSRKSLEGVWGWAHLGDPRWFTTCQGWWQGFEPTSWYRGVILQLAHRSNHPILRPSSPCWDACHCLAAFQRGDWDIKGRMTLQAWWDTAYSLQFYEREMIEFWCRWWQSSCQRPWNQITQGNLQTSRAIFLPSLFRPKMEVFLSQHMCLSKSATATQMTASAEDANKFALIRNVFKTSRFNRVPTNRGSSQSRLVGIVADGSHPFLDWHPSIESFW